MNRTKFLHGDVAKPVKVEAMKDLSSYWESKPNDKYRREVGCFILTVYQRRNLDWHGLILVQGSEKQSRLRESRNYNTAERAMRYCDEFIALQKVQIDEQE